MPTRFAKSFIISIVIHTIVFAILFGLFQNTSMLHISARWTGGNRTSSNVIWLKSVSNDAQGDRHALPARDDTSASLREASATKQSPRISQIQKKVPPTSNSNSSSSGNGIDSSGSELPSLLAQIRAKVMSHHNYPANARSEGVSGVVKVQFQITKDGGVESLSILQSSGSNELDQAALKSVKDAVPLPFIPNPIALPLEYRLNEME